MDQPPVGKIKGDSPLGSLEADEFGLGPMVKGVAETLACRVPDQGFTIGIEGAWGSGKSTFTNFVAEMLANYDDHAVIRFEPWLIGDKRALIPTFLGKFATEIDKISPKQWRWWHYRRWQSIWRASRLSKQIRKYGGYLGALSAPMAGAASVDPTGSAALAATGLKTAGLVSRFFGKDQTVDGLKATIVTGLRALQVHNTALRFTVLIDDTDRLDADEAVEILRLARKAADFPTVSYVICFDSRILSKQVSTALNVDGREYLERIFQDVIHIPPQEPFALRRYLKRLLKYSFRFEMSPQENESQYRLEVVFDRWCGRFLNTPRDVVRLHQAIQFAWPYVPVGSDFCDFLWLQLLKLKWPELYEFVRNYLQNVGSYRDRGRPGDSESVEQGKTLTTLLKNVGWLDRMFLSGIDEILPGIKSPLVFKGGEPIEVFKFDNGELDTYEQTRRLGSPSHWRGYFAFALPSYAVTDAELVALREAARSDAKDTAGILRKALDRPHERCGHFLDVLLDRLLDVQGGLTQEERAGLMQAFADVMDDVERVTGWGWKEGRNEIWEKTRFLLRKNPPGNFLMVVEKGDSINWLAYILRDQGFALGKPEGHRASPENSWLAAERFDESVGTMCGRLEVVGMQNVFVLPSPMEALLFWVQLGNADDVRIRFRAATKTHTGFLAALTALRGWASNSNTGVYHPLHAEIVKYFADPGETHSRLNNLALKGKPKHQPAAQALLGAWVQVGEW